MHLKLQKETRDYNLGTSLRNYIDPRVMRAWLTYVDLDWDAIYTTTLRRKFKWAEDYNSDDLKSFYHIQKETLGQEVKALQRETQNTIKQGENT